MEQWTGSKVGKEYNKAVYCYLAYLTYMQSEVKVSQSCSALCNAMDYTVHRILQVRLQQYMNYELQMCKLDLEKAEEPEIKLPTSTGSLKSMRISEKHLLLFH